MPWLGSGFLSPRHSGAEHHLDKVELVHIRGPELLHKRPPVFVLWWAVGQVGGTWEDRSDELSGCLRAPLRAPGSARQSEGAALWEHAAEEYFLIHLFFFGIWLFKNGIETTRRDKRTADQRDNEAKNGPRWDVYVCVHRKEATLVSYMLSF